MAAEVIMPRVDMDMTEGKIAFWYVKNGDTVTKGQALFDIETDKATMEVEAHVDGIVQGIQGEVGSLMPVGTVVAWLLAPGESVPTEASARASTSEAPVTSEGEALTATSVTAQRRAPISPEGGTKEDIRLPAAGSAQAPVSAPLGEMRATPLARELARRQQIDLRTVQGSGPRGRVVAADLAKAGADAGSAAPEPLHAKWLIEGAGTPLVLLHGFGADHASWKPFSSHLRSHATLAIDLPSHGKSPVGPDATSLADLAARVLLTLDRHGLSEFHLLGHSLGGAVALALVQQASPRVKSLTLLAPAGLGPDINGAFIDGLCRAESEASLRPWMAELVSDRQLLTGSFIATAHQQLAPAHKRAALRSMAQRLMPQGTQAESLRHVLDQLNVPTKVIWGTDDRIIPSHHGFNLPGQVGLHVLRGVGHLPYMERPQLVADLVVQQLRH